MRFFLSFFILFFSICLHAQTGYDSVTISKFVERKPSQGIGWERLTHAGYPADLVNERTIWVNPGKPGDIPYIFSLATRIRENGTKSLGRCFIPRHSINYYHAGKIALYLLVCFECNGMEFSDRPRADNGLLVSKDVRMKQIDELKILFKDHL